MVLTEIGAVMTALCRAGNLFSFLGSAGVILVIMALILVAIIGCISIFAKDDVNDRDTEENEPQNEPEEEEPEEKFVLFCEKFAARATSEEDAKERFFYGTLCDLCEENIPKDEEKRWEWLKLLVREMTLEVRKANNPVSDKLWTFLYEYVTWKYNKWKNEKGENGKGENEKGENEKGESEKREKVDKEKEMKEFSECFLQFVKDSVANRVNNVDTNALPRKWITRNIRRNEMDGKDFPRTEFMLLGKKITGEDIIAAGQGCTSKLLKKIGYTGNLEVAFHIFMNWGKNKDSSVTFENMWRLFVNSCNLATENVEEFRTALVLNPMYWFIDMMLRNFSNAEQESSTLGKLGNLLCALPSRIHAYWWYAIFERFDRELGLDLQREKEFNVLRTRTIYACVDEVCSVFHGNMGVFVYVAEHMEKYRDDLMYRIITISDTLSEIETRLEKPFGDEPDQKITVSQAYVWRMKANACYERSNFAAPIEQQSVVARFAVNCYLECEQWDLAVKALVPNCMLGLCHANSDGRRRTYNDFNRWVKALKDKWKATDKTRDILVTFMGLPNDDKEPSEGLSPPSVSDCRELCNQLKENEGEKTWGTFELRQMIIMALLRYKPFVDEMDSEVLDILNQIDATPKDWIKKRRSELLLNEALAKEQP